MKCITLVALLFACVALASAQRPHYCGIDVTNPPATPTYPSAPAGYRLSMVQALIRHGDRLPIDRCWSNEATWNCGSLDIEERSIPNSGARFENIGRLHRKNYLLDDNVFPGVCMAGQLTQYGYQQHLANAANLKQTYNGFLPTQLDPAALYLRSTDVPRTLQSAQALIRGLYPWTEQLNASTILDFYTVDASREWLYPNPGNCPKLAKYEADAKKSPAYLAWVNSTLNPTMALASQYYGLPIGQMPSPINVFDCLNAHKCHNYPLPGNLPDSVYKLVQTALEFEYQFVYNYPSRVEYGRIAMGRLVAEIMNNFVAVVQNGPSTTLPKFRLYSAHDTSVMPFLNAIGAWDGIWAPYASLVQMELWMQPSQQPLVRFIYNREPILIPGCSSHFCSLNDLTASLSPLFWNGPQDCGLSASKRSPQLGVYTNDGW